MNDKEDIYPGKRINSFVAVRSTARERYKPLWIFRCDCGNERENIGGKITRGDLKSCGCRQGNTSHNMSRTLEYRRWAAMKNRCNNPNSDKYDRYGGRGISVCNEWNECFDNFYADMGPCPDGHELDRIDNDGNYSRENCRWTTRTLNNQNTTRSVRWFFDGKEYPSREEGARAAKMPVMTFSRRCENETHGCRREGLYNG